MRMRRSHLIATAAAAAAIAAGHAAPVYAEPSREPAPKPPTPREPSRAERFADAERLTFARQKRARQAARQAKGMRHD